MTSTQTVLEDYFDFLDPLDIRIKGHRIGIDDVIDLYLEGYTPEQIVVSELPSLTLEKVYVTIAYYLLHRAEIDDYMLRLAEWREQHYREWLVNPQWHSPAAERIRAIKAQREREQVHQ